jgi:hypothetical protein
MVYSDVESGHRVKASPWGPTVLRSTALAARVGRDFQPCRGALKGTGKHSASARKVRKVGKVLSVMTRTPFLAFLTFLALVPRKKVVG